MNKKKVLILSLFYLLTHNYSIHGVNRNIEFMTAIPTDTGVRLYDVTKPARQDNGFEVLPDMTKADFAARFDDVFSSNAWSRYNKDDKKKLTKLLKNILKKWALIEKAQGRPFFDGPQIKTLFNGQIKRRLYNPDMHLILSKYIQHIFAPANAGHIASKLCEQYIRLASHMLNMPITTIYMNGSITGVRRNNEDEILASSVRNVIYKDTSGWYLCKYNNYITCAKYYYPDGTENSFKDISFWEDKIFKLPAKFKINGGIVNDTRVKHLMDATAPGIQHLLSKMKQDSQTTVNE